MKNLFIIIAAFASFTVYGQGQVGINTNNPHSSAALEISSDSTGLLIPRMTTQQIDSISNPANGLQVFNSDLQQVFFFNASTGGWQQLSSIWKISNDTVYYNDGNVGIGTSSPKSNLHISDDSPKIQFTNVNDYSIIIDLDDSDDAIKYFSNNGVIINQLFTITNDAKVGIGDIDPAATLHIVSDTPSFQITNINSRSIIIDLDDSDDAIAFNGAIGSVEKKLFSVTQEGNFGIGDMSSDTTLHLKDLSPFIKYTNANNFDFLLGLRDVNNSFTLTAPSLSFDFVNASSTGDLSLNANDAVSINPGIVSPVLSLYNPTTNDTVDVSVDTTGALSIPPTSVADRNFFVRYDVASNDSLYYNSASNINFVYSNLANGALNYSSSTAVFPASSIQINSDGYYSLNYAFLFRQVASSGTNPTVKVDIVVNGVVMDSHYYGVWNDVFDLKTLHKIYKFNGNDLVGISVSVHQHNNNTNHDVVIESSGSYLEFIKISN